MLRIKIYFTSDKKQKKLAVEQGLTRFSLDQTATTLRTSTFPSVRFVRDTILSKNTSVLVASGKVLLFIPVTDLSHVFLTRAWCDVVIEE